MKKEYTVFLLFLLILGLSGICQAQNYTLKNRAGYQTVYKNPIASIPVEKVQRDLISKLSEVYPNHHQRRKELFVQGMNDYSYLCRPNDAASVRILTSLNSMYYPHFTTMRLLYEQKIRGSRTPRY